MQEQDKNGKNEWEELDFNGLHGKMHDDDDDDAINVYGSSHIMKEQALPDRLTV